MDFIKTTEQSSPYQHLEKMSIDGLLNAMHEEDKTVPQAVEKALPQIKTLVEQVMMILSREVILIIQFHNGIMH